MLTINIFWGKILEMKIIAGKAKGRNVKANNRFATRPTLSRVKTSLFDMLGDKVKEAYFLDLYSGTGNIGLEALILVIGYLLSLYID